MKKMMRGEIGKEKLSIREAFESGLLRKLGAYLLPHKRLVAFLLFLTALITAVELSLPYILRLAIDTCLTSEGDAGILARFLSGEPIKDLATFSIFFIVLVFLRYLFDFSNIILMTKLSQEIMHSIRITIFDKVQSLSVTFFEKNPLGRLVTRVTNDVEALNSLFTQVMIYLLKDIFILAGILIILLRLSAGLSLVVFSLLPFILLATILFRIKVRNAYRRVRSELSKLNAFVQEHISGMEIIQLFAREKETFDKFDERSTAYYHSTMDQMKIMAVFNPFISFSSSFAAALIIWFGGRRYLEGTVTIGILFVFLEYVRMFFRPLSDLTEKYNILQSALAAGERVFQVLDSEEYIPEPENPLEMDGSGCRIDFRDVTFSYTDGIPVLRGLSFTIEKGESLAIVGPTGAGKSSIINLITRFYDVDSGEVLYNGKNVAEVDRSELRRRIGLVLQDVFLFSGDLRSNIVLNNLEIGEKTIREVITRVNADEFIDRLPGGLDTKLGEGGLTLSAGERQLLAFSRALAHDPDLLILDEATASIDTETEEKIQNAIAHLLEGRTSILIAHRLSTVQKADKILVIDDGEVKEMGTHKELIALGGIYRDLYSLA